MRYNEKVFSWLYPALNDFIYHYILYKEFYGVLEELPGDRELWVRSCNAHLKVATSSWCMVFGAKKNNQTHWKNLFDKNDIDSIREFQNYIFKHGNLNAEQWAKCWNLMVEFRNEFVVHKELEFNKSVPSFDYAYKVALLFDLWIRKKIQPDFLDFKTLAQLAEDYRKRARSTLDKTKNSCTD